MKRLSKRVICLLSAALLISVCASLFFTSVAAGDSIVTGYYVNSSKVYENDSVRITVYVKSLSLKTGVDIGGITDIDITRSVDGFYGGGEPMVTITSSDGKLLTYSVVFSSVTYRGGTNSFSFVVTYNGDASGTETLEFAVSECVPSSETTVYETTTAAETTTTWETTTKEDTTAPEKTTKTVAAPMVLITRGNLSGAIKPGTDFDLNVIIKNSGSPFTITNGTVTFEPSEGLILNENSSSKSVSDIRASTSKTVTVKLKTPKNIENASQSVIVSFKYYYQSSDGAVQDSASEKLLIPLAVSSSESTTESAAKATPNIIVSSYDYGGKPIAAGSGFSLDLTFRNTSKSLKVENLVMSVETGEGLSIASSSNTYYYDFVSAGESKTRKIKMNVTANAPSGGGVIDLSFRYEYVDKGTRSSGNSSERLFIPVYLPDRFTVTAPDSLFAVVNEELSLSLPYVNKSKGAANNVSAELIYDAEKGFCEFPTQNLGNFEAGKSGTIDFFLTPNVTEEMSVTVKISYETDMGDTKVIEIPIAFTPEAGMIIDDPGIYEPENPENNGGGSSAPIIIIIAAAVVAFIILFVVLRRRKKKKAAMAISADFDWSAPQPAETINNTSDRNETVT